MKVYEYTNKGARVENQDFVIHQILSSEVAIFVVADGMGGYSYGKAASRVISESIVDFVKININKYSAPELLKEAIVFANDNLRFKRLALGVKKMGAVVTVLLIINSEAYITWLGDSRIYIFRNGMNVYKTEDHSIINELTKIKALNTSSIEKYASIVTRSIMGDYNIGEIPVSHITPEIGDVFILCTDGFHKEIAMNEAVAFDYSKKELLDAKAHSIPDNYTFIKVEI